MQDPLIVVLDGHTLNPGDLSWAPLQSLGRCAIYDRSKPTEIVARAAKAEVVLTNKVVLNGDLLRQLPRLKYIGVMATGTNVVDLDAAKELGVVVTNVAGYSTPSVAQMVFAHLLNLAHQVGDHAAGIREGRWSKSEDWCYWDHRQIELSGLKLGIVGFGQIGRQVAKLAEAFGMQVLANNRSPVEHPPTVRMMNLDMVFRLSDVVTLHCPLTDETAGLVSRKRLGHMRQNAWLINTGRGQLIDEEALADALHDGQIAGAGLDVLSQEPPPEDHPLLSAPNCFITPHIAWATQSARHRLLAEVAENIEAYLAGNPRNVVN